MRQAQFYMGLYRLHLLCWTSYLDCGLPPSEIFRTGAEDWLNLLKSGGSKTPLESAMIIGDISTDKPLRDTIQFLPETVDQIIAYSAQLGE